MDKVVLGKTDLKVSVLGLGSGGYSRLGKSQNKSDSDAVKVLRTAIESVINLIDSSEVYGTEKIIGDVVKDVKREDVVISTKLAYKKQDGLKTFEEIEKSLDESLKNLRTDYIDIYHIHAATIEDYAGIIDRIYPVLNRFREKGKIRFIGVTEGFNGDTNHRMLSQAVTDDYWDVIMVGFNILNPSARKYVLKKAIEKNIGVLCMFAVRKALIDRENLKKVIQKMTNENMIKKDTIDMDNPLGFLFEDGVSSSVTDVAYRFCRYEPGIHSVLTGTGSTEHLEDNIKSVNKGPLSADILKKLDDIFGSVDNISGSWI